MVSVNEYYKVDLYHIWQLSKFVICNMRSKDDMHLRSLAYQLQFMDIFNVPEEIVLQEIIALSSLLFPTPVQTDYLDRITSNTDQSLFLCRNTNNELIGFKLGYANSPLEYYSWLGGIRPEYRNHGIATELMRKQHAWCMQQGYDSIVTKTSPSFKEMLSLNKKFGYLPEGEIVNSSGKTRILQRKKFDIHHSS